VRLVGDESAKISALAKQLGVSDPVQAGPRGTVLAFVDHRCPFLDARKLCRIHAEVAADQKPAVCRQYPLRSIVTESGQRVAVDPGCGSNWMVWKQGPVLDADHLLPAPDRRHSAQEAQVEGALVGLLRPPDDDDTQALARVVGALGGQSPSLAFLDGFARRCAERLAAMSLSTLVRRHAPTLEPWLDPVVSAQSPDPAAWPELSAEQQGFVLELARRSVFLRSGSVRPMGVGLALGTIVGALACARAHPSPERFGPALSAWTRLLRLPPVWMALYPDPLAVRRLAAGR
jgi:hypothetical protein